MTQYLLSVHHDGDADAARRPRTWSRPFKAVDAFNAELQAVGRLGVRRRPAPADTATVVRRPGRRRRS